MTDAIIPIRCVDNVLYVDHEVTARGVWSIGYNIDGKL